MHIKLKLKDASTKYVFMIHLPDQIRIANAVDVHSDCSTYAPDSRYSDLEAESDGPPEMVDS